MIPLQTIFRLWDHVENWIFKAITKNIPFIKSKKQSWNRPFLGHNPEICLASILFFSLECSQLFHSRKTVFFSLWATCGRRNVDEWQESTFLVLPQHASGLEPIVSQAQLVENCFALKQKGNTFALTHIYSVWECRSVCVWSRKREDNDTDSQVLNREQARLISRWCNVHSPFFEGNIHLSCCNKKK